MKKGSILLIILLLLLFVPGFPTNGSIVQAQDEPPDRPVYIVQPGDTYYSIAIKFNVTVEEIIEANPDVNPNLLGVGSEVVIPGFEGMKGRLMTQVIPLGETLRTLSIRNQVDLPQVLQLNRITSPAEAYAGYSLIVPQKDDFTQPQSRYLLSKNQSLFQVAAEKNLNPWLLAELNQSDSTWDLLPGEVIFDLPVEDEDTEVETINQVSLIAPVIKDLVIDPLPILQGETTVIRVKTAEPVELTGSLASRELHFFPDGENSYVALQGVHVMSDQGIYPFTLNGTLKDGSHFSFEQMVILQPLGYIQEKIEGVDPATIDPASTQPEEELITGIISKITPEKYWDGPFVVPGYDPEWITSTFGNRRSYNGGPFKYFHTGVDYGGGTGLPIKSPAAGVVVFAEPLTVRGNATIIDHGWGVYSGFWHQSEFQVKVGDRVEAGQVIGLIGGTGRVTGPHLHWEVWVNGIQVDPITWLNRSFP